jgi:hypothetical protein
MSLDKSLEGLAGLTEERDVKEHRDFLIIPTKSKRYVEFKKYRCVDVKGVISLGFFNQIEKYKSDGKQKPTITASTQDIYDKYLDICKASGFDMLLAPWIKKKGRPSGKKEENS